MLANGLYSLLSGLSGVQALVGTPSTRSDRTTGIFALQMPEATPLPAVVIDEVHGSSSPTLDGPSGLRTSRHSLTCYADVALDAKALALALWAELDGLQATLADGTQVDVAQIIGCVDSFEYEPLECQTTLDVEFIYREP